MCFVAYYIITHMTQLAHAWIYTKNVDLNPHWEIFNIFLVSLYGTTKVASAWIECEKKNYFFGEEPSKKITKKKRFAFFQVIRHSVL